MTALRGVGLNADIVGEVTWLGFYAVDQYKMLTNGRGSMLNVLRISLMDGPFLCLSLCYTYWGWVRSAAFAKLLRSHCDLPTPPPPPRPAARVFLECVMREF